MSNKLDWHTEKLKRPKQRKPYARSTEVHEDKKRYDRKKERDQAKRLIKDYVNG